MCGVEFTLAASYCVLESWPSELLKSEHKPLEVAQNDLMKGN